MNSASTHFISSGRMSMYDPTPMHQINTWGENFKSLGNINMSASMIVEVDSKLDNQLEDTSHGTQVPSKHTAKVLRRLAQNREAARKSRLRKKAYVQQLESSRLKLVHLEQELQIARQQSQYIGGGLEANHTGFSGPVNPVISTFELEYGIWVEEQNRQMHELRKALNTSLSNAQLSMLVHNGMRHYSELFCMKANAARADVIYLMSGMWKTPAERFFSWMGGFRPSELLKVLMPQLEPLSEQQVLDVCNLKQSCQQAEDALSQGMEKLQQTLAETIAAGELIEGIDFPQIDIAMDKLESLVSFATQADHLWQETIQQMDRILTIYQSARGLLALGEYFQRLRALSSLWATRPSEPA